MTYLWTEVLTSIGIESASSPSIVIEVVPTPSLSRTMTLRLILVTAIRFAIRSKHSKGVRN